MNLGNLMPLYPLNGFQASWGTVADKINSSIVAVAQIGVMIVGVSYLYQRGLKLFALTWVFFALGYYLFYAITSPPIMYWYALALALSLVNDEAGQPSRSRQVSISTSTLAFPTPAPRKKFRLFDSLKSA